MKNLILISILCIRYSVIYGIDSISKKHFKIPNGLSYSNNLSASYVAYKNWKYSGVNNFTFLIRENINYDTIANNFEIHTRFNGELGYMKFADSAWYKNTDYLDLSLEVVKVKNKIITNTFTFYLNSQFLSSYENYVNDSGLSSARWASGFGNPLCVDLAYGSSFKFWKTCRINLNYVTLRTTVNPYIQEMEYLNNTEFKYKKSIIQSEYGLSIQTFIRHQINSHLRIENYSRFFANAISQNHVEIDFRNKIIVKILKHLDLIFDSRIRYAPAPPYQFQFRNELMLSFSFEKY